MVENCLFPIILFSNTKLSQNCPSCSDFAQGSCLEISLSSTLSIIVTAHIQIQSPQEDFPDCTSRNSPFLEPRLDSQGGQGPIAPCFSYSFTGQQSQRGFNLRDGVLSLSSENSTEHRRHCTNICEMNEEMKETLKISLWRILRGI